MVGLCLLCPSGQNRDGAADRLWRKPGLESVTEQPGTKPWWRHRHPGDTVTKPVFPSISFLSGQEGPPLCDPLTSRDIEAQGGGWWYQSLGGNMVRLQSLGRV